MSNGHLRHPLDEVFGDEKNLSAGMNPVDVAVGIEPDSFALEDFNALPKVEQAVLEHIKRAAQGVGEVRSMFALLNFSEADILDAIEVLKEKGFIVQSDFGSGYYVLAREDIHTVISERDNARRLDPKVYEA